MDEEDDGERLGSGAWLRDWFDPPRPQAHAAWASITQRAAWRTETPPGQATTRALWRMLRSGARPLFRLRALGHLQSRRPRPLAPVLVVPHRASADRLFPVVLEASPERGISLLHPLTDDAWIPLSAFRRGEDGFEIGVSQSPAGDSLEFLVGLLPARHLGKLRSKPPTAHHLLAALLEWGEIGSTRARVAGSEEPAVEERMSLSVTEEPIATLRLGSIDDPWRVDFLPASRAGETGSLERGSVRSALHSLRRLRPPRGVQLPSRIAGAARIERECAVALLEGFLGGQRMQAVALALAAARGQAGAKPWALALDLRAARWRAVPWELLEQLPPSHPLAGTRVVRLVPTRVTRARRRIPTLVEVLLWTPGDDTETRELAQRHRSLLASLGAGGLEVRTLSPRLEDPPAARGADVLRILHVLTHGRYDAARVGEVLLQLAGGREVSTGTAARWLQPLLDSIDLAYVEACEGGSTVASHLDAPGPRLVAAGVPVCVAPRWTLPIDMSSRFTEGFYEAVVGGSSVLEAVAEGRRRVSETSPSLHRSWRWWNHTLVASDLGGPHLRIGGGEPVSLASLPPSASGAAPLLRIVQDLARRTGWLGIEHVALAFATRGRGVAGMALRPFEDALLESVAAYDLPEDTVVRPPASQAFEQAARLLPDGFGAIELAAAVCRSSSVEAIVGRESLERLAQRLMERPGSESTLIGPSSEPSSAASPLAQIRSVLEPPAPAAVGLTLLVVGGPDDGLRVVLDPSRPILGRQGKSSMEGGVLFCTPRPSSRRVSRRHLEWVVGRRIRLERSVFLTRNGSTARIEVRSGATTRPEFTLSPGDEIVLDVLLDGHGTRLRVL